MSLKSLPQELVDYLALFVGCSIDPRYDMTDVKSLLNFCLVSKQILSSARAALYRRPFLPFVTKDAQNAWPRSKKLFASLEASNGQNGRLVRETVGLSIRYRCLIWEYQSQPGYSAAKISAWYLRALKACLYVTQADIVFSTIDDFSNALNALNLLPCHRSDPLFPTRSLIRKLSIDFFPADPPTVDHTKIFELLHRTSIEALNSLSLDDISWFSHALPSSSLTFPILFRNLDWKTTHASDLAKCLPLLTSSPLSLDSLRFSITGTIDGSDLLSLTELADETLKSLHLRNFRGAWSYASAPRGPRLPPKIFESFPLLTTLSVAGIHGPSLVLLDILVTSSPLLSNISFTHSRWICDYNPPSSSPEAVFPEKEVIAIIKKFLHLKGIHLGLLPTDDPLRYEGTKGELEDWGIKVEYQICR
ncbi:hypothetical protein JCM5353_006033 [Sporobolomyces roseus]